MRRALADRFTVADEVGHGGMAVVLRATDLRHDRQVAIKVLYPDLARAVGGERFLREIGILARLSHPNILPLLDSGTFELVPGLSIPWYAMPFVAEETLRARLDREGPLPVATAIRLTEELCAALGHAHSQGFIHRDIKPENILLQGGHAVMADFGVARAVSVAGGSTLTSTGLVVGTPAYMSPEQSAGSERLDARSDLYSLGVVLYEMLAGHPPFTGSTPQAICARHQFEPPPPIEVVRPGLPGGLVETLRLLLAKLPADRFASAEECVTLLGSEPPSSSPGRRRRWALATLLLVLTAVGSWIGASRRQDIGLDPNRYAILPFQHRGGDSPTLIGAHDCAELVSAALAHWKDVTVVSSITVGNAINLEGVLDSLPRALAIARRTGAGRLIWGSVYQLSDSVLVEGVVFDTRTGRELRTKGIRFAVASGDLRLLAASFTEMVAVLVSPASGIPHPSLLLGTSSLAAYKAFISGDSAAQEWDLATARTHLRQALAFDPDFPSANLEFAEIGAWLDDDTTSWHPFARTAGIHASSLPEPDRFVASGLSALANNDFPAACAGFRAAIAADSLDFRGWFGLGQCLSRDPVLLRDPATLSGLGFRSSHHAAITAYTRALQLVPSAHRAFGGAAITRLAKVLVTDKGSLRRGILPGDSAVYAAFIGLDHDTIAYVPYPVADIVVGRGITPTTIEAVNRNRARLRQITASWLSAFPNSVPALVAHALSLELQGQVDSTARDGAAAVIRRARQVATAREQVPLMTLEARLRLKAGDYAGLVQLADSALARRPFDAGNAADLSGLAAATGRVFQAADLAALAADRDSLIDSEGRVVAAPPELRRLAARLLVFAAFGSPRDSVLGLARLIRERSRLALSPLEQPRVYQALTARAALLAFPDLPIPPLKAPDYRIAAALARHDTASARVLLAQLEILRLSRAPGDIAIDATLLESRMRLAAGDSAGARHALDVGLSALRYAGTYLLTDLPQAAAVGRAMQLSNRLAPSSWGAGFRTLWPDSSKSLR